MRAVGTVRARITVLATAVVLVVLVVAAIGLVILQRRLLTEALDESLEDRANDIAAYGEDPPPVLTGLGEDDAVAQVVREPREVIASSANVQGLDPIVPVYGGPRFRTVDELPHEDEPFRVVVDTVPGVVIIVAGPLEDIDESIATLRQSLLVAVPLVVLALAAVLWWLTGRALRPVEAIRTEVASMGGRDLHRRVPVPPGDDEIARLASTMNGMLDRVEDASHELRSPLTRIRTELEVDLAHPGEADPLATHTSVLEETVGLQRLADDLLLVARADGGQAEMIRTERVDLDDLVLRVARRLRADDRVRIDFTGVGAGQVIGDADQLARLVGNLADNGVRHASSSVRFGLTEDGGSVVLTVEDDGPGVPAAERERIFERFARVDGARNADAGGTGLGLAIARDIAHAHGGTLVLDPDVPGARFVLTIQAAPT